MQLHQNFCREHDRGRMPAKILVTVKLECVECSRSVMYLSGKSKLEGTAMGLGSRSPARQ